LDRTEGAGRRPCSRSRTSSRPIRNARIVPESDLAGMTAIVPHQSSVTPLIVISRLDVEDDFGDPFLRIDGEAVPRHGLDYELQLVPLLVDRLPPRAALERRPHDPRLERPEEEPLRSVDVPWFPEPSADERR